MPVTANRKQGEVFLDARGNGRAMRLTWHHEFDLVVLSLWREGTCAGTFRLSRQDVAGFVDALVDGLRAAPGTAFAPGGTDRGTAASGPPTGAGVSFTDWMFGGSAGAAAS